MDTTDKLGGGKKGGNYGLQGMENQGDSSARISFSSRQKVQSFEM